MLSAIVTDPEAAEVFFLIALIVFVIATVISTMSKAFESALVAGGLAFTAAAFLWL
jgi:hypothetical protein